MKEAVILQSPHAIDPMKNLTEAEKVERYRTRLDETFRPYTVVDVLTGVYHRCFEDDLRNYIFSCKSSIPTTISRRSST